MIGSCELKARVEESLGTVLDPDFFGQAEQYARRKLDMCNERAGRIYGEDGYGDEYLVLLTADTVREMAFSAWCEIRNAEITAAREKAVAHEKKKTGPSEVEIRLFLSELPERPVHQGRRQRARRRLLGEGGREGRRRPSRPDPRR